MTAYRPSPRPTFDGPAAIPYAQCHATHLGRPRGGEVADWIYASTERVHALVFGLAPGAWFRHSPEFRTIFGADELLYVLRGTMVHRESGDGRGAARAARRQRVLPRRHLAPRPRARERGAARARAVRAAARDRLVGRLRAHEAVPRAGRLALRRRRSARASCRAPSPRGARCSSRRSSGGARSACSRASTPAPSTSPPACSS